ncbi:DUF1349 domain-containing protein [Lichenifustis flavocetrariae]|uniref:DUF1349 domain-containing protein n=1 Tax=Lichenifustis flavocetrariae TaxID=2949735 RepID=A0AA42CNI7_9HYPH|nr:DUF1349 domain-containing protein [Lichenifustis flavocetrariae]MCW6512841.1 DUF1349 domain-containing protein [Lichenifustis flavocetrariae]
MPNVDLRSGTWLNRPAGVKAERDRLVVTTEAGTDFWRHTHYGFIRDTGHFLGFDVGPSFSAEIRICAHYETLYDQAGLMLRAAPELWVKAGVEFSDGCPRLAVVVTDHRSDWSLSGAPNELSDLRLRMTLKDEALRIQASTDHRTWTLLRLTPFASHGRPLRVGPMCCTPERAGLDVELSDLSIGPANTADLHDTSGIAANTTQID